MVHIGHKERTFIIAGFGLLAPNQARIYCSSVIPLCRRECWIVLKAQSHLYQKPHTVICDSPSRQQFSLGMFLLCPKPRISCLTGHRTDCQGDLGKKQTKIRLLETLQGGTPACFSTPILWSLTGLIFSPNFYQLDSVLSLQKKNESYLIRDASGARNVMALTELTAHFTLLILTSVKHYSGL